MTRKICIGDVHGCFDELQLLLEKLEWNVEKDVLIFLGDLINRGPESAKVVNWIMTWNKRFPCNVIAVQGNHDNKVYRFWKHEQKSSKHKNYTNPMITFNTDKLSVYNSLSDEEIKWLGNLPVIHTIKPGWIAVHAGFEPGKAVSEQDQSKVSHIRYLEKGTNKPVSLQNSYLQPENSLYWTDVYDGKENVVYGHNVHSLTKPRIYNGLYGNKLIGIDTGCCFGGHITGFIVPEDGEEVTDASFVQQKAFRMYQRSIVHFPPEEYNTIDLGTARS